MKIFKNLATALFCVVLVAAQDDSAPSTNGSADNGDTTVGSTIFEMLSTNGSAYNSSGFVNLLNSDTGYQSIIQILSEPTNNLTAFIPDDSVLTNIVNAYKKFNYDHHINTTSEYPPANWSYHNVSVLDVLYYHVVNESFLLTNLTTGNVSIAYSLLNNSDIDHLVNSSLPILIQSNATYENATNQTWVQENAEYLKFNVGNGVNFSTVALNDLNATNGHFNIIKSVLIPPLEPSLTIPEVSNVTYFKKLLHQYPMLNSSLDNAMNFTIFAPIDKAFKDLNIQNYDIEALRQLASSHVVQGIYYSTNFTNVTDPVHELNLTTFNNNSTLPVSVNGSLIELNGTAKVVRSNIFFNNGVLHIIDRALNATTNVTTNATSGSA
ncbi:FAS1 domain-containing protein [Sporodiniella umbellata]|nr:FAS1 domain-containing protein [Sporodiniella umbellata]